MKRQSAKGAGVYQNKTSKEINRISWNKQRRLTIVADAHRKYLSETMEENPLTFLEFKEEYYKKRNKKNKNVTKVTEATLETQNPPEKIPVGTKFRSTYSGPRK